MTKLFRESPLPPVVHETLEEQPFGRPERVYVVLEEQSEVPFEADMERPAFELTSHQTPHIVDVDAGEFERDAEGGDRCDDS